MLSYTKKLFAPMGAGGGAVLLGIATILSNLLGWGRDAFFVRVFGTDAFTDSYFKAFLIPDTLLTIFVTGALLGLLIPLYLRARQISAEEGAKAFGTFFTVLNGCYAGAALLLLLFLQPLIIFLFPDTLPTQIPVLVNITAILLGANFFFAVSNFLGHFLLAHKHFFSYAVAPIFYNLGIIIGIYLWHDSFGIYAAAWGGLFGAFLHFLSRLFDLWWSPERFRFSADLKNPFFRELLKGIYPKVIALVSLQVGFYFFARMGDALLTTGSYSAFQYARNLQSFVVVLFGVSLATAVFPFLAEFVAAQETEKFLWRLEKSMRQILFLTIPSACGMALLSSELVRLTYGSSAANVLTVTVLIPLAVAIPFESILQLSVRAFHVLKSTVIPMFSSLIFLAVLIGAAYFSATKLHLGVMAFGASYICAFIIQFIFLQYYLEKISAPFPWREFLPKFGKTLVLSALMSLAVIFFQGVLGNQHVLLRLFLPAGIGTLVFFGGAYLWNCPEVSELPIKRWLRKKVEVEGIGPGRL